MKPRRIGFGDFIHDGPNPLARSIYLHAVSEFVPEALRALVEVPEPRTNEERVRLTGLPAWADEWGFTDAWAFECAARHAGRWRDNPTTFGHWIVTFGHWIVGAKFWEPVFPPDPKWNPTEETEQAFRARVDSYIEFVKNMPGIQKAPDKRGPEHFKWLALHHVGRQTYEQIAALYENGGPNFGSISQAITETADMIGLTLRPKPGRKLG